MSKWKEIAKDGMPPETNRCYLVFVSESRCQYTAMVDRATNKWCTWSIEESYVEVVHQEEITHWREVPKNP